MKLQDKMLKSFSEKKLWKIFQKTDDTELKQKIDLEFKERERLMFKGEYRSVKVK